MRWLWLSVALLLGACSTLIGPDPDRLGGTDDAGQVTLMDSGVPTGDADVPPPPPRDADVPPPPRDADVPPPRDAGCTIEPSCAEGVVTTCDGTETCLLGCAPSGEARCAEMVPSNVPASLWLADAPDLVIDNPGDPLTFDTTTCMARMAPSVVQRQEGGGEVCVIQVGDFVIRSRSGLVVRGDRPLVIMANGDVTIEAEAALDASARGVVPGPGGGRGGLPASPAGEGPAPGQGGAHVGTYDDGGGGGGALCGAGGTGGQGDDAAGGAGGSAISAAFLVPLRAGSGGGLGDGGRAGGGPGGGGAGNTGLGGAGGGALQISARGSITVEGFVLAGGGGGRGADNDDRYTNWGAGGGGGSGGAILLEAPTVTLGGGAGVTTSGGGGGGGGGESSAGDDGQDGAMTLGQANGGGGGGFRYGGNGGDGGGGATLDGEDGTDRASGGANGGGAGGGAGCVVYRTLDGLGPSNAAMRTSGSVGPSLTTAAIQLR